MSSRRARSPENSASSESARLAGRAGLSQSAGQLDPRALLDFSRRAEISEWMDQPCSYEEFRACLRDLARVNRVTLAYRPTLVWLDRLVRRNGLCGGLAGRPQHGSQPQPLHIVDLGSGQGDMLRRIAQWAKRASPSVRLTGIDLNPYAAQTAAEQTKTSGSAKIEWLTSDAFSYAPAEGIDVVISSLFTHHLPDDQIVQFLIWMESHARRGWFINDLHRGPVPYHLFRLLARVAHWHPFVQHDGPVSIRRSFRVEDWTRYLELAGIDRTSVRIETFRPARLCVGRLK